MFCAACDCTSFGRLSAGWPTISRASARSRVVGIFPEGGIRDGPRSVLEGAPPKPGTAALAQMAGAPILPCAIVGSDRLYNPRMWLPLRRVRVWIAFGEPIFAPEGLEKN